MNPKKIEPFKSFIHGYGSAYQVKSNWREIEKPKPLFDSKPMEGELEHTLRMENYERAAFLRDKIEELKEQENDFHRRF